MRLPSLSTFLPLSLLALSLAPLPSIAGADTLYTDAVTYCAEAKAVLVEEFDIAYHKSNKSVTFSFSLASVESNLNVSVNLYLNIYGIQAVNFTLDLCSLLEGVLCPLPQVNFTGYGTYPIPSEYADKLDEMPYKLAWTVPNIEAYARIQLIRDGSDEVAACLQATLSNGLSTRQTAVAWSTGIFTLLALLAGLFHTAATNSPSPAQYRWFDILFLFQAAAASGFMHLNYPLAYSSFTLNFHWAMGLFHSTAMQNTINKMRARTGGHLDSTAYSDVQYINRQFSPYNVYISLNEATSSPSAFQSFLAQSAIDKRDLPQLESRATIPSELAQNATSDLSTGLPVYSNTLNIPEANAFDTIFFFMLAFIAIAIAVHVLLYAITWIFDRSARETKSGGSWALRLRRTWWDFCMGNALRLCLIWFFPVFIFAFWQFNIGDSGLSIFFAVFAILLCLVPLTTVFVLSVLRDRNTSSTAPGVSPLYTSYRWFHSVGMIYRAYRQKFHFFWFIPILMTMIARAGFIAFGPTSAWAQVIGNVLMEFIILVALIACRPHKDRKGDWLTVFLSIFRLVAFGLLIAFIPSIGVKPIIRAVLGFVIIAAFGLATVLLFFGFIWNLGYGYLWRRHTHRIEDGLEVERFVASDDDSSRPAMQQVDQIDAATFVSSDAAAASRGSLGRRTSIMEPVGTVYESSLSSNSRHHKLSNASRSRSQSHFYANDSSSTSPTSIEGDNHRQSAAAAYEEAAKGGRLHDQAPSPISAFHNQNTYPTMAPRASSPAVSATGRPLSGHNHYQTNPTSPTSTSDRWSGARY